MMKIKIIIPVFISFVLAALPSHGDIKFPAPENLIAAIDNYTYPADARHSRYLVLRGENLDYLAGLSLEQYRDLEAVVIEFTENPEATDELKEKKISAVDKNLVYLKNLRKCVKLKYVIFHTGVFIFIRTTDRLPYRSPDPSALIKADRLNLERLNKRFGKKLEELLPGITVYAHNWGW